MQARVLKATPQAWHLSSCFLPGRESEIGNDGLARGPRLEGNGLTHWSAWQARRSTTWRCQNNDPHSPAVTNQGQVRSQSVSARGVLLEPDNIFIVRRDVVVTVPVQILGRIVGPWIEPAVAFHVPVTKSDG